MHLVENYALAAASKIAKPTIKTSYFPVGSRKYITLHASSGMGSKNYDYYKDVIKIIQPKIKNLGYEIIQIGEQGEAHIDGSTSLLGQTTIRQALFVIKNSSLHIGNDSFSCHAAGAYDVPMVILYGPSRPECCGPYWGDKTKQELLAPDFSSLKPSYSLEESPKRINKIFPDKVAEKALNLLNIPNELNLINPIHLGESFYLSIIDVVPDFASHDKLPFAKGSSINIRSDYTDEEQYLEGWLSSHKTVVHINRMIDLNLLFKYKDNIQKIFLYMDETFTQDYMSDIDRLAIKTVLYHNNKETITEARIKFFGENIYPNEPETKKDLDFPDKICNNSFYQSSLNLFSKDKIYPCKAALDRQIEKQSEHKIIDDPEFYRESEFFKIYNYAKKKENN
ncbi:MAG: hypothetical protein CMO74_14300 [Verrucomicrobiales bacterium]|nr:hypothetical protein [Verrucomicrobiales bacterium]|tara:strand:+ start:94222 stop:95406 length:1185 start_codon:yes stop_codon:yes gene_type:complete